MILRGRFCQAGPRATQGCGSVVEDTDLGPLRHRAALHYHSIMANIGSVFLGDVQRNRLRSSGSTPASTPPSSPPPISLTSRGATHSPTATTTSDPAVPDSILEQGKPALQPHLAPEQSLELRVRWLEAILYGAKYEEPLAGLRERKPGLKRGETLVRAAEHAHRRMNDIASNYDVLRRFIGHCEPLPPSPLLQPNSQQPRRAACAILDPRLRAVWHAPDSYTPGI